MYNTIKTCIQRTTRMDDNYSTVKDIIDSLHFAPGTKNQIALYGQNRTKPMHRENSYCYCS